MKKTSKQMKEEVTLENLDGKLSSLDKKMDIFISSTLKRFDSNDRAISELVSTVYSLAVSTARGFSHIDTLFVKQTNEMQGLDEGIRSVRMNVMDLGERFVSHHRFNELTLRVNKLEKGKK